MAGLSCFVRLTGAATGSGTNKALCHIVAPDNQKIYVYFRVHFKYTSTTGVHIPCEIRRGITTTGGALSSALTINNRNGFDTETPRSAAYTWATPPTTPASGTVVDEASVEPRNPWQFRGVLLNENETLDFVVLAPSQDTNYDLVVDIIE